MRRTGKSILERRERHLGKPDQTARAAHQYTEVKPNAKTWFSFRPVVAKGNYAEWPSVVEFADAEPISGLQEMRRGALMSLDKQTLADRMAQYFDKGTSWPEFSALGTGLSKPAGRFDPVEARTRIQTAETFDQGQIKRYGLYPFDTRWCYYSRVRPLWNEPRPELVGRHPDGEPFFIVRRFAERPKEGRPVTVTTAIPDYHLLRPNSVTHSPYNREGNQNSKGAVANDLSVWRSHFFFFLRRNLLIFLSG